MSDGVFFFFFNDTATTEIYTLSLHDALPICKESGLRPRQTGFAALSSPASPTASPNRSEEHTSELQSQSNLVCRLLLEKKKQTRHRIAIHRPNRRGQESDLPDLQHLLVVLEV